MRTWAIALVVALPLSHAPTFPRLSAQEVSITIYSGGDALVRRTFSSAVTRGIQSHALDFGLSAADPGSFVALDEGVAIRAAFVSAAAGKDASLLQSIGRELEFAIPGHDSTIWRRGTLLSLNPFAVRMGGRVTFSLPGEIGFPDSLAVLTQRVAVITESTRPLPALRIGYFAPGLSWRASYTAVVPRIGGGPATVSGTATIDNARLTARAAEIQLASGDIRREAPAPRPQAGLNAYANRGVQLSAISVTAVQDEGSVAETRLYSLPGRLDLVPGVTTSAALFASVAAAVERLFIIQQRRGLFAQWGEYADSNIHPDVVYRIRRPDSSAFGEIALPEGIIRVFAPDTAGRVQLLGEASIGATPRGRDVEVTTGTASDVVADRVQTEFDRRNEREVTTAYRVTIRNGKDESVSVAVDEMVNGHWDVVNSSVAPERLSAFRVRFLMPVPARSTQVLEYRIHTRT